MGNQILFVNKQDNICAVVDMDKVKYLAKASDGNGIYLSFMDNTKFYIIEPKTAFPLSDEIDDIIRTIIDKIWSDIDIIDLDDILARAREGKL